MTQCQWMSASRKWTDAPTILAYITHHNRASCWTAHEVLMRADMEERAKALRFFIDVAEHCRRMRNFDMLFALVGGLLITPVFRLKFTWLLLEREYQKRWTALKLLCRYGTPRAVVS